MVMKKKYGILLSPWKIRDLEIKNRIVMAPMGGTTIFGWTEPNHFDKEAAKLFLDGGRKSAYNRDNEFYPFGKDAPCS